MKKIKRVLVSWVLTGAIAGSIVLSDATPAFSSILGNSKELVETASNAKRSEREDNNSSNSIPATSKQKVATASNATKDEYKGDDSLETDKEKSISKSTKKATPSNATFHREFPTSDGITIVIEIEDASLPKDTKIQIKKVEDQKNDDIKTLVEDAIDEDTSVEEVYAYDISFWSDGEEFEPDGVIKVSFRFSDAFSEAQIKDAEIFHLQDDDSDISFMQKEIQDNNKISCYADGFSIYGVAMIAASTERIFKTVTEDGFTLSINDQYNKMPDDAVINAAKIAGNDRQKLVELAKERYETDNTKISAAYFYKISFSSSIKDINNDFYFRITSDVPKSYIESVMSKAVMNAIENDMSKYDPYGRDFGDYGLDLIACDISNTCPIISIVILKDECIPIYTPEELLRINDNLAGDYILMEDLDLSEMGDWEPIGGRLGERQFTGSLDGNGHSISNMTINMESDDANTRICVGLFGRLDGARIGNLKMIDSSINVRSAGDAYVGTVAGWSPTLVAMGGGSNSGDSSELFDCSALHGTITAELGKDGYVGGIIGNNENDVISNITSCYSTTDISANAGQNLYAGGIVGYEGSVSNCENGGNIEAKATRSAYVGGISGSSASVEKSVNTGEIDVEVHHEKSASSLENIIAEAYVGGIVGNKGEINNCYNTGNIKVTSTAINTHPSNGSARATLLVGGIAGRTEYKLSSCYNVGAIESTIDAQSPNGQTTKTDFVGGIVGEVTGSISPEHCYYINSYMSGIGKAMPEFASNACKRLTSEEMKQQESFYGFDFDNIWIMGNASYLYPVFNTQAEIEWPIDPIDPSEGLKIISCSLLDGPVNNDSDIVLKFNRAISDVIGITNGEKCEIRVYISDETLFTWDDKYTDYSINGDTVTLHGVFKDLTDWNGQMLYLYIPDGFFRSADDESDILTGCTDKASYSFVLSIQGYNFYYVQYKYEKDGELILQFYKAVAPGDLCPNIEGAKWENHEFVDWYTDPEFKHKFDFTLPINRNYILYAKYVYSPSTNTESGSHNNTSSSSDLSSDSDSHIYEADLRDSGFTNMSDGLWMVYKDGKPLTGYQENLYYKGEQGSFLFDENGFMLTGWHDVNGELKYFDETLGHRGYEIKPSFIAEKVRRSRASKSLGQFDYAGTFAQDLSFFDATNFLICDYDDINDIVKRWLITGRNPVYTNDDWAQEHLKSILNNLLNDGHSPKYYSFKKDDEDSGKDDENSDDKLTIVVTPLLKEAGYETVSDMMKYMKDAMGYSEDMVNAMFGSYASNIAMLQQYKEICPELSSAIDGLIHEYQNTVAGNLRKSAIDKLVEETNVKNLNDLYKELSSTKNGTLEDAKTARLGSDQLVETLITKLFATTLQDNLKDLTNVSDLEDVIYSAYPRNSALKALNRAEQNLIANPNSYDAQNEYIAAFDIALESTKIQYFAMYEYYSKKGEESIAQKLYDDYVKLSNMNFMNY